MKRTAFFLSFLFVLFVVSASAQTGNTPILQGVEERRAVLDEIAAELANNPKPEYLILRERLRRVRDDAAITSRPLKDMRENATSDLERLGPAPEAGQSDSPDTASLRAQLTDELRVIDDGVRQADLNIARATRLLKEISASRRKIFYDNILARGTSPLLSAVWKPAWLSFKDGQQRLKETVSAWQKKRRAAGDMVTHIASLLAALCFAIFVFGPARRWIDKNFLKRIQAFKPTQSSLRVAAGLRVASRVVPGIVGGLVVVETARMLGLVNATMNSFVVTLWFGLLALLFVDGVTTAVFAPRLQDWRLIPLVSNSAAQVRILLISAAILFFLDGILKSGSTFFGSTEELIRLQSSIVAIIGAAILLMLGRKSLWRLDEARGTLHSPKTLHQWTTLRRLGNAAAMFAIFAALVGYNALSLYIVTRIFFVTGVLVAAWFLRILIQEAINYFEGHATAAAKKDDAISEESEKLFFFWIGVIIDVVIFVLLLPVLLIVLGVDWIEVRDWLRDAFFGFKVGSITISLAQILSAIVTFAFFITATRFLQRGIDKRIFSQAKIDDGVRNSLRTLLGYVGLIIGVVTAIAVLGVNLSSLAIIAGALSLGIGFGLQSIVNNFVSGLILLFERPIKVGDWIIVSSGEGIVKRISVRSTEIETFDKSSIIVPNSELISSAVTNWTHKDKYSRLIVPVGVSYNEDPERIIEILDKVIANNKSIVKLPKPYVYFSGFGDSSLDFEMRIFIKDIDHRVIVQNELRITVFSAFKEAGVEIPFPQRDLHIKSAPPSIGSAE